MHICAKTFGMKNIVFVLLLLLSSSSFALDFTVKWTFAGVEDGYDHDSKMMAYVDGNKVGESPVSKQTAAGSYTFTVPKGIHTIRVENYAFYEGEWELHSMANSYSADAFYESELDLKKNTTLVLVFDLDAQTTDATITTSGKAPKVKKGKAVPLTVAWSFTGVVDGYDHQNRMQVYVDGQLVGTSKEMKQTTSGTYSVDVPKGNHTIRIENYTLYEETWEPHTKENEYSVDAFYVGELNFAKKQRTVKLVFDIDNETTTAEVE